MGGLCSTLDEETRRNREIARAQEKAGAQAQRMIKLLLLGTGDSGKTTLRKQMRTLYGDGFSEVARKQTAIVILGNLFEGLSEVIRAMAKQEPPLAFEDPATKQAADMILETVSIPSSLSSEQGEGIKLVLKDPNFQTCLANRTDLQMQDCWDGFAASAATFPSWGGDTWVPTVQECVSVRVRTSGIVEESLTIDGVRFNIFDVGGQRAERRKWIHSFDNVTAVIFVTAISEYDQVLFEDRTKNRLEEALELFEEICNSRWFVKVPILLFLNKKDIFEKKIAAGVPLNASGAFPTAPTDVDYKRAVDWITAQFLKRKKADRDVYTNVVCSTDPGNVLAVFEVCKAIIIKRSLLMSGFAAPDDLA